jgi:hypothetical protein
LSPRQNASRDHRVGRLGAFEERQQIEPAVGHADLAQAVLDVGSEPGEVAAGPRQFGGRGRRRGAWGVGAFAAFEPSRHRFLFVLGASAEDRIEPEAEESGDQARMTISMITCTVFRSSPPLRARIRRDRCNGWIAIVPQIGTDYK